MVAQVNSFILLVFTEHILYTITDTWDTLMVKKKTPYSHGALMLVGEVHKGHRKNRKAERELGELGAEGVATILNIVIREAGSEQTCDGAEGWGQECSRRKTAGAKALWQVGVTARRVVWLE